MAGSDTKLPRLQASGLTVATRGIDLAVPLYGRKGKQGAVSQLLGIGNCQVSYIPCQLISSCVQIGIWKLIISLLLFMGNNFAGADGQGFHA
jgi:hypothetical protein